MREDEALLFEGFSLNRRGLYRIDPAGGEEPVELGSRALGLLRLLVGRPGDIVSKDTIMAEVWPSTTVEESNLTVQISALRRVLDRDGHPSLIQTVSGRGYRFTSHVKEKEAAPPAAPALPDRPSIVVLPFQNMSSDPEQDYFADGMVEEITTALSRICWLFVIARNSSFTYKGHSVDVRQVGRELGVRYLLEGSVRRASNRVRITAQLIEAESGAHLWADRFDGSLEDVFDLQDRVAVSVAGVIEPALQAAETRRHAHRPTKDLSAYDLYLRALPFMQSLTEEGEGRALDFLKEAVRRDPGYAPAIAGLASCHMQIAFNGWTSEPGVHRAAAIAHAQRALAADAYDPDTLARSALVLAWFGEDLGAMRALLDRALTLNPNYAYGWYIGGVLGMLAGEPEAAIASLQRSMRLSPRAPVGLHSLILGMAYIEMRNFAEAVSRLLMAVQQRPTSPYAYRGLAACYAHMGRLDEARVALAKLSGLSPISTPSETIHRHRRVFLSGLRLAMDDTE